MYVSAAVSPDALHGNAMPRHGTPWADLIWPDLA